MMRRRTCFRGGNSLGLARQRRMRTQRVVQHSPALDHDLGLLQRIKDLSVQALIPEFSVEAFAVAVLPGTSRLNVQRPPVPSSPSHCLTSFATNSGTLSERRCSGTPRESITSASASITSYLPSLLANSLASSVHSYSAKNTM